MLDVCRRSSHAAPEGNLTLMNFVNVWLNRNMYIHLQDFINERITDKSKKADVNEICEVFRVWLLQMIHRETANTLFTEPDCYGKVQQIKISLERCKFLFGALGANLPEFDIFEHDDEADDDTATARIWGSFHQYNPLILKIEREFGSTGSNFIFEGNATVTIDDDKLRHGSTRFRAEGLQVTGFRGSKIGPVMNGVGTCENGIILSAHFSRHSDGPLSTVKSLLRHLGYSADPDDNTLRSKCCIEVKMDRGYHTEPVVSFLHDLGCKCLGAHSEFAV